MKKTFPLFIVILLVSGSFTMIGTSHDLGIQTKTILINFSNPQIQQSEQYLTIDISGANTVYYHAGKPLLPMYSNTITFPFPTEIVSIDYAVKEIHTMLVPEKIKPGLKPTIRGYETTVNELSVSTETYNQNELFPEDWIAFFTGGGRDSNGQHKTFLTYRVFPARYNPELYTVKYIDEIELTITYKEPKENPFPTMSSYDLVVITPQVFVRDLEKLVGHKNAHGIRTTVKTLEEIYEEYAGVDKPEQIKFFIKDALDKWYIKYILLVGGMKSSIYGVPRDDRNQGTQDWYFPVRYSNLKDDYDIYDPGFISDLYFADIYDGKGDFSSWDYNGDGIFGGWDLPPRIGDPPRNTFDKDLIDLYTDLSIGRLACRNHYELRTMIKKIINYESSRADPLWYNRIIVVGGDPWIEEETNYYEGEEIGEKALSYMTGFEAIRLFASYGQNNPDYTPLTKNILRELNQGCGFILFDGHATPGWWNTCWPNEFPRTIKNGGLCLKDFTKIFNKEKLPIMVVGGCHSSLINVSLLNSLSDKFNNKCSWTLGHPIPECWSWILTRKSNGGAIATIGSTGLGYEADGESGDLDGDGINEPDCVEKLGGYEEVQFYKKISENTYYLGDAWAGAINNYLKAFPGMEDSWDAKVVEQWILLGDPSLRIGGYP